MIPSGARSQGFDVQSSAASIAPSATSMCCQKPPNDRVFREASSSRRILVWSSAFLLGPVPVVNTMALLRLGTSETRSRLPSRYAPSPRYAHQRVLRAGALANPATISPFDSIPISVPNVGIPRENSSVPSIGSMIIRARPEVLADCASPPPISSPRTSIASPLPATLARAISSTLRSACVTAVPSPFLSMRSSSARKYRIAIASASSAIASNSDPYVSPYPIRSPYSRYIIGLAFSVTSHESPVTNNQSPDLTLSSRTPSIQTYANVCSSQHRNRPRSDSRGSPRRSRSSQTRLPETALKYGVKAATPLRNFSAALCRDTLNVLAELKPASPSRGVLRDPFDPEALAQSLESAGASALSVLTEGEFFRSSLKNLRDARKSIQLPVLRKDFIFDPWQVWESRANDADSFLLIVATLEDGLLRDLIALGRELGMEPLVEVHTGEELDRALHAGAKIVGVNNRDLKTLTVRAETSLELIDQIPDHCIAVSESGLRSHDDLLRLRDAGFDAFLIGEHLMLAPDPAVALASLLGVAPQGQSL